MFPEKERDDSDNKKNSSINTEGDDDLEAKKELLRCDEGERDENDRADALLGKIGVSAGATADDEIDEDIPSPPPPPLERARARQISRVGAISIAGIGASSSPYVLDSEQSSSSSPPTLPGSLLPSTSINQQTPDEENNLDARSSCAEASAQDSSSTLPSAINVTATLVTDDEYEAEIQRAIMRTAVRASKVEAIPEEEERRDGLQRPKWNGPVIFCSIFGTFLLLIVILGLSFYLVAPEDAFGDGSDDPDRIPDDPILSDDYVLNQNEEVLVNFLKNRSFDGGEALRQYASPQRIALRYIAAEFPTPISLDEKLIDVYAVATFFFSTGGTFWTNNTKWKSRDPVCIWHGIGCDENGHVVSIALSQKNLQGTIPPELGLLAPRKVSPTASTTGLTKLDFSGNAIEGYLPEQLGLLTMMEEFYVHDNILNGEIPPSFANWRKLSNASFVNNNLSGEVPPSICLQNHTVTIAVDCPLIKCECCTPACAALEETTPQPTIDPMEYDPDSSNSTDPSSASPPTDPSSASPPTTEENRARDETSSDDD